MISINKDLIFKAKHTHCFCNFTKYKWIHFIYKKYFKKVVNFKRMEEVNPSVMKCGEFDRLFSFH